MDLGKLFRVLVIGGSALGAGCDPDELPPQFPTPDSDAGDVAVDSGPVSSDAGSAGEPALCFCDTPTGSFSCCDALPDGSHRTQAGFECCWGTAC